MARASTRTEQKSPHPPTEIPAPSGLHEPVCVLNAATSLAATAVEPFMTWLKIPPTYSVFPDRARASTSAVSLLFVSRIPPERSCHDRPSHRSTSECGAPPANVNSPPT